MKGKMMGVGSGLTVKTQRDDFAFFEKLERTVNGRERKESGIDVGC